MTLNPEEYDIWIDKHLRGEMTEDEKITFERMLREDKNFAQKVEEMKVINAGIRQAVLEEKWALMEQWEDEMTGDPSAVPEEIHPEHNTKLLVWMATAAVIVLAIIFMWPEVDLSVKRGPSKEYAALFEPGEFEKLIKHETLRSADDKDPYTAEQRRAYNLFAGKLFPEAITKLEKLWEEDRDSIALYYLAHSYLAIGNDVNGKELLNLYLDKFK